MKVSRHMARWRIVSRHMQRWLRLERLSSSQPPRREEAANQRPPGIQGRSHGIRSHPRARRGKTLRSRHLDTTVRRCRSLQLNQLRPRRWVNVVCFRSVRVEVDGVYLNRGRRCSLRVFSSMDSNNEVQMMETLCNYIIIILVVHHNRLCLLFNRITSMRERSFWRIKVCLLDSEQFCAS